MNTNFPKVFPQAQFNTLLEISKSGSVDFDGFLKVNREATFALGSLLTKYRNEFPQDLDSVKAPQGSVADEVQRIMDEKGETAAHAMGSLTKDELVYLMAFCQQMLEKYSRWTPSENPTTQVVSESKTDEQADPKKQPINSESEISGIIGQDDNAKATPSTQPEHKEALQEKKDTK